MLEINQMEARKLGDSWLNLMPLGGGPNHNYL